MKRALVTAGAAIVFGLGLCSADAPGQTHWNSVERARIFAVLPNWSGLWESRFAAASDTLSGYASINAAQFLEAIPLAGAPPYKAGWERQRQEDAHDTKPLKACTHIRFPFLLEAPFMFQVFVTPEEVLFLYDNGEARHIYTDGRTHPTKADLWATDTGNSTGRWVGATLIIDTIAVKAGPIAPVHGLANLSAQAHFIERVRMIKHDALEDDLEIDDPLRFTHPWTVSTVWSRVLDQDRMLPYDCDKDRNPIVDGRVSFAQPR